MVLFTLLIVYIPTIILVCLSASVIYRISVNYCQARTIGIPIIIAPFTWQTPAWLLIAPAFMWIQHLPFGTGKWIKYSFLGWPVTDKTAIHDEMGPAFVLVTSQKNEIWLADPCASLEVLDKWRVFTKPNEIFQIFETFGQNVVTINGDDWQRHRKIAAVAFKERNAKLFWNESKRQAKQMLARAQQNGVSTMAEVRQHFVLLAMHVLSAAALGHRYDYGTGLSTVDPGHKMSYLASLSYMMRSLVTLMVFKDTKLRHWLLPKKLQHMFQSISEFRQYMEESVESRIKAGSTYEGAELISALVNANEIAKNESKQADAKPMHLSREELYSNLFIFNVAGFETTSTTMTFSIPYLAAMPELQEWIQEEVDAVRKSGKLEVYEEAFPLLPRTLALMYEVLRVHSAIPNAVRISPPDQSVNLGFRHPSSPSHHKLVVPPNTFVMPNFYALNLLPSLWGPDANQFKPQRWIESVPNSAERVHASNGSNSPQNSTRSLLGESLKAEPSSLDNPRNSVSPHGAIFVVWAHGPRVCPGKKFSQVEYVAVMTTLLSHYKIEPVGDLMSLVNKAGFGITPELYRPQDAGIRLVPR